MNFNDHSSLQGMHALLSPSKYHWIRYDDEKITQYFINHMAVERGVRLHAYAEESINLGQKLPRSKKTLNMYVNDSIGYKMNSEQILYYSPYCFGTADSISFEKNLLRLHDLKTGATPAHIEQLEIYAALFCLEYNKKPKNIDMDLRIYQNDDVIYHEPDPTDVSNIMERIISGDKIINSLEY